MFSHCGVFSLALAGKWLLFITQNGVKEKISYEIGIFAGCTVSVILFLAAFNIFLEYVVDELGNLQQTLMLNHDLSSDICYVDDTTLIAAVFNNLKISTKELESSCKK